MNLIWATRGRTWGFRFLLDGGHPSPLATYESAFIGADNEVTLCRRSGGRIALRFPDPQGRTDAAGRTIPHDFVIMSPTVAAITSVDDGLREVWPVVADVYAGVWDSETPPSVAAIRSALAG
ncbi:MAG TPA: hypothetical protein DEA59_12215, partial [Microbacterium sp.]|nr:hypothetical protein [Microbacterium sp.]